MLQASLTSIWTRCKWMYRWQNEVSGWKKKKLSGFKWIVHVCFFLNLGCYFSFSLKKCLLGKSSHGGTFGVVFLGGRGRFLILQTTTRKARVSMDTFKTWIFFSRYSCTFVYIFFFELLSRIFFFSDLLFWFFKMLLLWNWCFKENFFKAPKDLH